MASPACLLGCYNQSSLCPDDLNWWANGTFLCALRHTCPSRRKFAPERQENVYLLARRSLKSAVTYEVVHCWSILKPLYFFSFCHVLLPPSCLPPTQSLSLARCLLPCLLRPAIPDNCLCPSLLGFWSLFLVSQVMKPLSLGFFSEPPASGRLYSLLTAFHNGCCWVLWVMGLLGEQ